MQITKILLFAFATCLWLPPSAMGEIVVSVAPTDFQSGPDVSQFSVEVFVDLTEADDGGQIDLANFQVRTQLTGLNAGTDVSVVGVGETRSSEHPQARDLTAATVVSSEEAFGFTLNFGNSFLLDDQAGLMRIDLEVQPHVTGAYFLEILPGDGNTLLTDGSDFTTPLEFTTSSGVINITSIPEPSSVVLLSMVLTMVALRRRRPN